MAEDKKTNESGPLELSLIFLIGGRGGEISCKDMLEKLKVEGDEKYLEFLVRYSKSDLLDAGNKTIYFTKKGKEFYENLEKIYADKTTENNIKNGS